MPFDSTQIADTFIRQLPNMIVPTAVGVVILWRQWVLEKHVDGRIDELKPLLIEKGKLEGIREAKAEIREAKEDARADRKEFKEALLTPIVMPPDPDPPKKGK